MSLGARLLALVKRHGATVFGLLLLGAALYVVQREFRTLSWDDIKGALDGTPPRALLSLATGAGKTVIAANLLWRLHEAGLLGKPALFLCDRDELREQALDKIGRAFPGGSVRAVRPEAGGLNAARNARVHIATYQTLGIDGEPGEDGAPGADSFLSRHYGENAFSVIVIDECHRSAWGRWSAVLQRNPQAIQIGLTATPRQLRALAAAPTVQAIRPNRFRRRAAASL